LTLKSGAVPVPDSVAVCGEPAALSVTVRVAPKLASDAGVKVTVMEQLDPEARDVPQLLVWEKSLGLAPAMAILPIARAALPVLESVAVCDALVVPLVALKVSEEGVSEAMGTGGAVPVPLSVTPCGDPVALSDMETEAVSLPGVVGAKLTAMVQVEFAARGLAPMQLSLSTKFAAPVPVTAIAVMARGVVPEFFRITFCAALVVPSVWLPKFNCMGVTVITGEAEEKFAVTLCAAFMVTVVEALLALATLPVQLLNA